MEKLLKRVISVVCAIAMVVTCITFTPSTVSAGEALPKDQWKQVGPWQLYNGMDGWCHYATMEYEQTGNQMGDVKMILKSSGFDDGDSEYGLGAKLLNYSADKGLETDYTYNCNVTYTSTSAGTLIVNIEGKEYRKAIEAGENVTTTLATFDHDALATTADVIFYPTLLPKNTELSISKVEFIRPADDNWIPVTNTNPDLGEEAKYVHAGQVDLMAMYGPKSKLWGKMKYMVEGDGSNLSDTKIKINSASGWQAWSVSARLTDYLENVDVETNTGVEHGLVNGDEYNCTIKLRSNLPTPLDKYDDPTPIRISVGGTVKDVPLDAGLNTITINDVKYNSEKPHVEFDFDCVEVKEGKTELSIEEVSFTPNDPEWTKVPNEEAITVGAWNLFARFGTSIEEGQWGKLSYLNTKDDPKNIEDTKIKVRSSSGYLGAWVTLGTLTDYIDGNEELGHQKLEKGKTYRPVIRYTSSKATGKDDSGDTKKVLMSVDNTDIPFSLKKSESESDVIEQELIEFTYEEQKFEHIYDVIFNFDQVEPGTELHILSLTFEEVQDGWTPVRNDKADRMGTTDMYLYARFDAETSSWGKTSYNFENNPAPSGKDYSKVLIKTRTVSGWYIDDNPASEIIFRDLAKNEMKEANRYKIRVTLTADRDDEIKAYDGTKEERYNNIKFILDKGDPGIGQKPAKEFLFEKLEDGKEQVLETDYFTFYNYSDDLELVLDEFTPNATLRIKSVEFIHDSDTPNWTALDENATAQDVGMWSLYSNFNAATESWGKIFYTLGSDPQNVMGDVTMNAFGTSGWIGARSIRAVLSNYTKDLKIGENYAAYITIDSSEDCFGKNDKGDNKGIDVTIDDYHYMIPIHKGKHTYVIPRLNEGYRAASTNVAFDLDMLTPETVLNISAVDFKTPVDDPVEVSSVAVKDNGNKTATVTWEQTKDTIYGVVGNEGNFKIYVDDQLVDTVDGSTRSYTTGNLAIGKHSIKVVATLGILSTTGKTVNVDISGDAPTPTVKPTVKPTKAPVVAKPGKATVKKAVKKKKSAKKIKITLKKVAGAKKYQVAVYKTKKNAKKNKKALVKKTITKLTATIKSKKLKGKKTVYVRARAWNTAGFGAWSGVKKSKKK